MCYSDSVKNWREQDAAMGRALLRIRALEEMPRRVYQVPPDHRWRAVRRVPGQAGLHRPPDNITDPDISLSYSNLEFVCKDCHDQFDGHGVAKSLTQKIFFDAAGDPIPPSREAGAPAESPHALPRKNTQPVHEAPPTKARR